MSHTIALVDDDQNILTSVSMTLKAEGFKVQRYENGETGLEGMQKSMPDIAVLDVKMPRMNGFELLTELRKTSDIPVIFLTSVDDEVDQVHGLRIGADDYITKPFSQKLLIERIKVLLRRIAIDSEKTSVKEENDKKEEIIRGDLTLDENRHLCLWKGSNVNLTVTEYLLLKTLADKPGHVKSRDQLIDAAYGENIYVDDRTIDSHIKRLRQKFRKIEPGFDRIETLYGIGYRYKED